MHLRVRFLQIRSQVSLIPEYSLVTVNLATVFA